MTSPILWACVDTEQPGRKAMEKQSCSPGAARKHSKNPEARARPEDGEEGSAVPSLGHTVALTGCLHKMGPVNIPSWMRRRLLRPALTEELVASE